MNEKKKMLLTAATVCYLAHLAMQLAIWTGSLEHLVSVGVVYIASKFCSVYCTF